MLLVIALLSYLMGSLSFTALLRPTVNVRFLNSTSNSFQGHAHNTYLVLAVCGDFLKSTIPLFIAKSQQLDNSTLGWLIVANCLGQLFPLVSSYPFENDLIKTLGGLVILSWSIALLAVTIWTGAFVVSRYAPLASLVTVASVWIAILFFFSSHIHLPMTFIAGILLSKHSNCWRLG